MKISSVLKFVLSLALAIPVIGTGAYYMMNAESVPFETVCIKGHEKYTNLCDNVGKRALTLKKVRAVSNTDFGEIIGVAWRTRGTMISSPGQSMRYSESNSYYYIIKADTKGYYSLKIITEIDPE